MTRKALIIVCPGQANARGYLPGALVDANNYEKFFYSYYGGDWYASEIEVLKNPNVNEVKEKIGEIESDYSFVVFSGHGGTGHADDRMYVDLADGDIQVNQLLTESKRQTLIIDSCRSIFRQILNESELKAFADRSMGRVINSRKEFERHLEICEEGVITIYSCARGQAAGEDEEVGGIFSSSLIKAGRNWGNSSGENHVLDLEDAFKGALQIMNREFVTRQQPELNGGRRYLYFPFAIR